MDGPVRPQPRTETVLQKNQQDQPQDIAETMLVGRDPPQRSGEKRKLRHELTVEEYILWLV